MATPLAQPLKPLAAEALVGAAWTSRTSMWSTTEPTSPLDRRHASFLILVPAIDAPAAMEAIRTEQMRLRVSACSVLALVGTDKLQNIVTKKLDWY
jgi:hypothetical protein